MLEKIREFLQDNLDIDPDVVTLEANLKDDLGADSLDLYELVCTMESEYGIDLPPEELEDCQTVGDFIEYLKDKGIED